MAKIIIVFVFVLAVAHNSAASKIQKRAEDLQEALEILSRWVGDFTFFEAHHGSPSASADDPGESMQAQKRQFMGGYGMSPSYAAQTHPPYGYHSGYGAMASAPMDNGFHPSYYYVPIKKPPKEKEEKDKEAKKGAPGKDPPRPAPESSNMAGPLMKNPIGPASTKQKDMAGKFTKNFLGRSWSSVSQQETDGRVPDRPSSKYGAPIRYLGRKDNEDVDESQEEDREEGPFVQVPEKELRSFLNAYFISKKSEKRISKVPRPPSVQIPERVIEELQASLQEQGPRKPTKGRGNVKSSVKAMQRRLARVQEEVDYPGLGELEEPELEPDLMDESKTDGESGTEEHLPGEVPGLTHQLGKEPGLKDDDYVKIPRSLLARLASPPPVPEEEPDLVDDGYVKIPTSVLASVDRTAPNYPPTVDEAPMQTPERGFGDMNYPHPMPNRFPNHQGSQNGDNMNYPPPMQNYPPPMMTNRHPDQGSQNGDMNYPPPMSNDSPPMPNRFPNQGSQNDDMNYPPPMQNYPHPMPNSHPDHGRQNGDMNYPPSMSNYSPSMPDHFRNQGSQNDDMTQNYPNPLPNRLPNQETQTGDRRMSNYPPPTPNLAPNPGRQPVGVMPEYRPGGSDPELFNQNQMRNYR